MHRPPFPQDIIVVLIYFRGWFYPRTIVLPEDNVNKKFQWYYLKLNLRTFGLQRRLANKCATACLQRSLNHSNFFVWNIKQICWTKSVIWGFKNDTVICRFVEQKITEIWPWNVERYSVWKDSQTSHEHQRFNASGHRGHKYTTLNLSFEIFSSRPDIRSGPRPSHCSDCEITLRHTTLGRNPPKVWPARHRDLYLTQHCNQKRQYSCPGRDSNPQS
jgi:hypothetical protein